MDRNLIASELLKAAKEMTAAKSVYKERWSTGRAMYNDELKAARAELTEAEKKLKGEKKILSTAQKVMKDAVWTWDKARQEFAKSERAYNRDITRIDKAFDKFEKALFKEEDLAEKG